MAETLVSNSGQKTQQCFVLRRSCTNIPVEQRAEALQAPGVQVQWVAHEGLVEQAEVTTVLKDWLDGSKAFQVYDLKSTQQETDAVLQAVCLLLQAAIEGQLLKQLKPHQSQVRKHPAVALALASTTGREAAVLWSTHDGRPWFPAGRVRKRSFLTGQQTQQCVLRTQINRAERSGLLSSQSYRPPHAVDC